MLRPIEPLAPASLRGVDFNEDVGEPPEMRWVDPRILLVDETYQRSLSEGSITLIRRILRKFDWASFKAPVVVETADGLKVTDGQHSAIIAATHPGIDKIPVLVNRERSTQAEARSFLNQNANQLNVTRTQLHHSSLAAGDAVALHIQRIADEVGVRILKNQTPEFRPGDTIAVGTLKRIYHDRGPAKLRVYLDLLKTRRPVMALELNAVDALMHDPDFRAHWDTEAVRSIVTASSGYETGEAEAIAATHMKPKYMALAMVWFRRMPRKVAPPELRRFPRLAAG